jgi:hypothetical protein
MQLITALNGYQILVAAAETERLSNIMLNLEKILDFTLEFKMMPTMICI